MKSDSANKSIISKLGKSGFRAFHYERPGVSADQVQEIKDAFDLYDPEKTGFVSTHELLASLQALGVEPRQQPLYYMISNRLADGVTSMEFEQFLEMMTSRVSVKDTKSDMRKVFHLFDEQRTGFITLQGLKKMVRDMGENIDQAQLQEMIERADFDKDGQISEQEFYNVMTRKQNRHE